MSSIFFNSRELPYLAPARSAGAFLLTCAGRGENLPPPHEPPYLFCGNGSCRDCNLQIDGYDDIPSCRIAIVPGMSLRSGEGSGEENALSRNLRGLELEDDAPLVADLIVVGAGPAGRAASEEARALGRGPIVLDARSGVMGRRPVAASSGSLYVWENGRRRLIRARAVILATGARDAGNLFERYPSLGPRPEGSDPVFGRRRREPQLTLAKALGCRTSFDRGLGYDRLSVDPSGATSVPGIFAAGDVVRIGEEREAVESGVRAARSATDLTAR